MIHGLERDSSALINLFCEGLARYPKLRHISYISLFSLMT
jgi:hypothetical protein